MTPPPPASLAAPPLNESPVAFARICFGGLLEGGEDIYFCGAEHNLFIAICNFFYISAFWVALAPYPHCQPPLYRPSDQHSRST